MRLFGLIGYPLSHSFSENYFTDKFRKESITDCRYRLFPIGHIDGLTALLTDNPELCGLNVTIPYKEQVLPFLHDADESVKQIRACNCIVIENGQLKGYNTDATGFERSLQEKLQPHHRQALILGTGGAAKAIEFVLQKLGISYTHVSRTPSAGQYSYEALTPDQIAAHPLIINTTPLGMYPATEAAPPIPYESLTPAHYLFDLVYNPEKTLFLQKGEEQGAAIKNGHDMLVIQAEESWRIWNS
ncbi:MAG: shikimate dehydrogenase [Chitinophagaceae bacterium]